MKKIILLLIFTAFAFPSRYDSVSGNNYMILSDSSYTLTDSGLSDSLPSHLPPMIGEKIIRYMYKPDKKRIDSERGPKRYYVLKVSTDMMEGGIRRAMPFITLVRGGESYSVAFEVVTSFETKEEALKYAEDNRVKDIDLTDYTYGLPPDKPPVNLSDSLVSDLHTSPFIGEKFIRYMHMPEKKRRDEDPGPMRYYVLEVSTDRMGNGEYRAMPFTSIERDGKEYFVAFELVTSFETEEEVLKYAEENGITDIDLKGYIDVPEDEPTDIPEKPGKD